MHRANEREGQVFRPSTEDSPAFDLHYVRSGPRSTTPILVIPGGPGLGSIAPYRGFRRWAANGGLDVLMVEHRGIGRSRNARTGDPLPQSAMTVDDVLDDFAAVLDHQGVERAIIVGSSYGSYLASCFGAKFPERVAGMVLDSALQATTDLELERELLRSLFWNADTPTARSVRALDGRGADAHALLDVTRAAFELCGERFTEQLLEQRLRFRWSPTWLVLQTYAARDESILRIPGHYEFDIAGAIGFRELGYGARPDGHPFDPALTYAPIASHFPEFTGEPYDLLAAAPHFDWPLALVVGTRDLRTPPAVAHRVASIAPQAVLVELENGHSALDTHPAALLNVIRTLTRGRPERIPALAQKLSQLPRRGAGGKFPTWLRVLLAMERTVTGRIPGRAPRAPRSG